MIRAEAQCLGGNTQRVFIGGHSQGCQLAIETFLEFEGKVGGVLGLTGKNSGIMDGRNNMDRKKDVPLLLFSGSSDWILNIGSVKPTYEALKRYGFSVDH